MSTVSYQQGSLTQIYSDDCPPKVAPLARYVIQWGNQTGDNKAIFNFGAVIPAAIRGLQGAYIDNSGCAVDVTFTDPLGNTFVIKAGHEAMMPCWYVTGGTAQISAPLAALECFLGTLGNNTAIEFLNDAPPNFEQWEAGSPAGVVEINEVTAGGAYNFGAIADGCIYTNLFALVATYDQNTQMTFASLAVQQAKSVVIEEFVSGVVIPEFVTTQGTTGFFGVLSVFSGSSPILTGPYSARSQATWPLNISPSAPVQSQQLARTKFKLFSNQGNAANGVPATEFYCNISNGNGSGPLPAMVVNLSVKLRILS